MSSVSAQLDAGPPNALSAFPGAEVGFAAAAVATRKLMIVDDEPVNIKVVRKYLQACGYQSFVTTSDSTKALDIIRSERPDLVLLDVVMPGLNGLDLLKMMRQEKDLRFLPVLVLTASSDPETKFRALQLGATDFLPKPVDPADLAPRVRNALMVKAHQDHLANYAEELEQQVRRRTAELVASRQDVIHCLARAGEYRDNLTGNHVLRVGLYSGAIARQLKLPEDYVELIEQAALLHDIGKIGVSDLILLKPGKLTSDEFSVIKKHCQFGQDIIQPNADERWRSLGTYSKSQNVNIEIGSSTLMTMAARIAQTHHERWDGQGYPEGLAGESIPLEGRITAVADVFDALSSERPYKPALPWKRCFEIMEEERGTHFDPQVFDAFLAINAEILDIQKEFADSKR